MSKWAYFDHASIFHEREYGSRGLLNIIRVIYGQAWDAMPHRPKGTLDNSPAFPTPEPSCASAKSRRDPRK
jgi:hypothetical protein